MSTQDVFDGTQSSPSPAPRAVKSMLQFSRPARGKRSVNDLRKAPSTASLRQQSGNTGSMNSEDDELSRSSSPAPSVLSAGHTSSATREVGIEMASEALQKLMNDAHSGSFAAGLLGQKLLDQQEHMRRLMQQLEQSSGKENDNSNSNILAEQVQSEIMHMKQEQQEFVRKLLQDSNTEMGAVGISATTKAEAEAIVQSYGGGMPSSTSYNSLSATPTKPVSSNAREIRRQKNAAAPMSTKDEGLVNGIQAHLVDEVRRLHALVAERDKALAALAESVEEASRFKAMQEANIKKLETEKDAKDAQLYEAEIKEATAREENEEVTKQLKKNENEVRLLRRQLGEKTDVAESLKVTTEDLEQRVEDMQNNLATLRAKGAADQMTINGLKSQVGDLELKQRQSASKIVPSTSNLSSVLSYDHGSVDSMHGRDDTIALDGPTGRRGGAFDQMLSPSASLDDSMVNRLRPSEAVKSLESDVAKWKSAALKYRKKWSDEKRQSTTGGDNNGKNSQDYDDSTDEDEDSWMEEATKADGIRKRTASIRSRIVSSASSRKIAKTMGDAFGFARHNKGSTAWEEEEEGGTPDRSFGDGDDASSNAASSTRGSIDGFDPHFADPTIRSGAEAKAAKRRSTFTPANLLAAKGSPLARQLQLPGDSDDEGNVSNDRPSSVIYEPGALGDELRDLQEPEDDSVSREIHGNEELMEQHRAAMESALGEMDRVHEAALTEMENAHQTVLTQTKEQHESLLRETVALHLAAMSQKEEDHSASLVQRDGAHQDRVETLQKEHAQSLTQQSAAHTKIIGQLQDKHTNALNSREEQHESEVSELVQKYEMKIKDLTSKQEKQHEDAMNFARERHTEALSKAREEAQAELVNAQMEHRRLLEERQKKHQTQVEHLESMHERSLLQRDHDHKNHVDDIEATNKLFQQQCDESFEKMLSQRNQVVEEQNLLLSAKERNIADLKARLGSLEKELEALRRKDHASDSKILMQSQTLERIQEQLRVEQSERKAAEKKLSSLPSDSDYSRKMSMETEDEYEDAEDSSQAGFASLSRSTSTIGEETINNFNLIPIVADTKSKAVDTPLREVADVHKETGAQTDDAIWTDYLQSQISSIRPSSSLQEVDQSVEKPGPVEVVVLGDSLALSTPNADASRQVRDSVSTFGGNRHDTRAESPAPVMYSVAAVTGMGATNGECRPSVDSAVVSNPDEESVNQLLPVSQSPDRSKPPVMTVPPPPSMPPPTSIPVKSTRTPLTNLDAKVNEPTDNSLPREELTPKGPKNKLRVPPESGSRPSSRVSGPPPSSYHGRASVRSGTNGSEVDKFKPSNSASKRESDTASLMSRSSLLRGGYHQTPNSIRAPSAQSFASDYTSDVSRMSGVSSRASDYNEGSSHQQRSMIVGPGNQSVTTDPLVLNAITQTMIGDYLFKYTRKIMGRAGHSDKRHQRYFWIHPYTRTLFWTLQAPAEAVAAEATNKSAFIQDVVVVDDTNNTPPGLFYKSILVITQAREVKITAPTKQKHDLWVNALSYLVNRDPGTPAMDKGPNEWRQSITRASLGAGARQRSQTSGPASGYGSASVSKRPSLLSPARSFATIAKRNASTDKVDRELTPRARGYSTSQASAAQRRDTAAKEYLEHWETLKKFSSKPASIRVSAVGGGGSSSITGGRQSAMSNRSDLPAEPMDPRLMTPEQMLEEDQGDKSFDFDGLDNVRSCCNGRHDVSKLDHKSHHHQQHRPARSRASTTTSAAGSVRQTRKSKSKAEDGPLKLTGNAPPQLGALNLNTMQSTSKRNVDPLTKMSVGSTKETSDDWFSANEFGGLTTMERASPNKAPSYSERLSQIRRGTHQPWLR